MYKVAHLYRNPHAAFVRGCNHGGKPTRFNYDAMPFEQLVKPLYSFFVSSAHDVKTDRAFRAAISKKAKELNKSLSTRKVIGGYLIVLCIKREKAPEGAFL